MLLIQIEQQRLDLVHTTQEWIEYTAPIDNYCRMFIRMRKTIFLGVAVMILFTLRKPSKAIKLSRTAIKAWGTTRLVQRLLNY